MGQSGESYYCYDRINILLQIKLTIDQTNSMNRALMLQQLERETHWDIIIIGAGATGLGAAVDAATRGYKTLLLEQHDFAKGTSSRSTKLLHGGVRYLAQGNFKLVFEALRERGLLLKNAPHVSSTSSFIIPAYKWWERAYYGVGLKMYDLLAGKLGLGSTRILSSTTTQTLLPTLKTLGLKGGIEYKDGQFDDTRLAINLAQTAVENGATVLNYCGVTKLLKENKKVTGVVIKDNLGQKEFSARASVVINATGIFVDSILAMDKSGQPPLVTVSQGVHLVLSKKFFPGKDAMMIPNTSDGRVLFVVPWHDMVVVGTTDTPVQNISLEPAALDVEINFILEHFNLYFKATITRADVCSVFAGLRPLVKIPSLKKTSLLPRDHSIMVTESNLVTITGGKWTTYRKMAEDVVNRAAKTGGLSKKECVTKQTKIHGWVNEANDQEPLNFYGADLLEFKKLNSENEVWSTLLHPNYPYSQACVIFAVRNEMAITVEDVLARRTRLLFLDARAAIAAAPIVAKLMAQEMNQSPAWIEQQINEFNNLANSYLLKPTNL